MKRYNKCLAILLTVMIISLGICQVADAAQVSADRLVSRLHGTNRILTAIRVSREAYTKSDSVILAGYYGQIDALAGTLLAATKDIPLLLTYKNSISSDLQEELERLEVKNVYILGGEAAVNKAVENSLKENYTVIRVKGSNRETTAVEVAKEASVQTKRVFLANGYDALADALAIGPVSALKGMPLLLTQKNKLSPATIDAMRDLGVTHVTIVGGEAAVSKTVEDQLKKDYIVDRVKGANREETALAIAREYFEVPKKAVIANGYVYADATVGGYFATLNDAPILLTSVNKISPKTIDYIKANTESAYVLGGEAAVSKEVFVDVDAAIKEIIEAERFSIEGTGIAGTSHIINAEFKNSKNLLYRFYYRDVGADKWTLIQDYSEDNIATWIPKDEGDYLYRVDVKYKNSPNDKDFSEERSVVINQSIPIYYKTTQYGYTLDQALDKQVGRNTKWGKGAWVPATREEIEQYLNPNNFLQFEPKDEKKGIVTASSLNVRKGPGTSYDIIGQTLNGEVHKLLSESNGWYEIDFKGVKGWVSGSYIELIANHYLPAVKIKANTLNVREEPNDTSSIISTVSNGEIYIVLDVVLDEMNGWRKINANGKIGWISGAYADYVKDVPNEMYQFMILSGQAGVTVDQMNSELVGKGILEGKGASYIEGSKKYNVNELYLMAHSFLETGHGTSELATGVLVEELTDDKGEAIPVEPKVVYNMYGIGAYDSDPVKWGSERAYREGWFTPEIAIVEGAHWISKNYINNSSYKQDTLYKMKFNPESPGDHQYATDIAWAHKQRIQIENIMEYCYRLKGVTLRFDIPQYK